MSNQGFFGALWQYWNIQEKPRLDRRNTYFDDKLDMVSNYDALVFGICFIVVALAIFSAWLLVSALIIFPSLSAMRVFKSFKAVTICSAVFSVICAFLGMVISILAGTPVGSTIVAVDVVAFLIFCIAGKIRGGIWI